MESVDYRTSTRDFVVDGFSGSTDILQKTLGKNILICKDRKGSIGISDFPVGFGKPDLFACYKNLG